MPATLIEVKKEYSKEEQVAIIENVHSALQKALQIPVTDKVIRLITHESHQFTSPGEIEHPELYTLISIDMIIGRTIETKRILYMEIVNNLKSLGIPEDHILIIVREGVLENFGIQGGIPASDVDLGFKVSI